MGVEDAEPTDPLSSLEREYAANVARRFVKQPGLATRAINTLPDGSIEAAEDSVIDLNSRKAQNLIYRIDVDLAEYPDITQELAKDLEDMIAAFPEDLTKSVLTYLDFKRFQKDNSPDKGKWSVPDFSHLKDELAYKGKHVEDAELDTTRD